MPRRLLSIVVCLAAVAVAGGLAYWAWTEGVEERRREERRELSIKEPARRITLPGTQDVAIRLDAETQQRLGLQTVAVQQAQRQRTLRLLGHAVLVPHRLTEVRSPWMGTLQAPAEGPPLTVGRSIQAGQSLGTLLVQWSPSDRIQLENQLRDTHGTVGETEAASGVARSTVQRLRQVMEGAVAAKQLVEAEGELAKLDVRLQAARARESTLREALAKQDTGLRHEFTAPRAGQLTELSCRPGEVVSAGELVATLYDPQEVWVKALVPPQPLPTVMPATAELIFPGFAEQTLSGRLVQASPQSDPEQQAREYIYGALQPQADRPLPVGVQAEVRVQVGAPLDVLTVPSSAVLQRNEQRLVYLQRNAEEFQKFVVEVEDEDARLVYLRPTLPKGAQVVSRGAQLLLGEEYKESIQLVEDSGGPDKD